MLYLDNELSWHLLLCLFYSGNKNLNYFKVRVRQTDFLPIGFQAVDPTPYPTPPRGAIVILVSADNLMTMCQDEKTLQRWYVYEHKTVELYDVYLSVDDRNKLDAVSTSLKTESTTSKNKNFLDAYQNIYLRCYANISGFDVDIKTILCANIDPSLAEVSDFCGKTPGSILCSCNGGSRCDFNSACRYSGAFLEYTKADLPDWQSSPTCPGIATNAAMTKNSSTKNIAMNLNVHSDPAGKSVGGVQQHDAVLYNNTTSILFSAVLLFFVFLLFYFIKKSRQ